MSLKLKPLYATPVRKICPVCGHASYSAGGIHPQCAVRRADAQRIEAGKESAGQAKANIESPRKKSWHRFCPRCDAQIHVRNKLCKCGYSFDKIRARGKQGA